MKKLLLTILVGTLVFTGCKATTKPEETTISTSESSSETTESTTEATSEIEETSKEVTESETKKEGSIKGTIDDITMSTLTVKAEDGTIMEFNTEGAEIVSGDGLAIEDKIEVTYEGKKAIKVVEFQ